MCRAGPPGHDEGMLTTARPRWSAPHPNGPALSTATAWAASSATAWVTLIAAAVVSSRTSGHLNCTGSWKPLCGNATAAAQPVP